MCRGSLVCPTLVVTAAHCVLELVDDTAAKLPDDVPGFKIKVLLGRNTLSGTGGEEIEPRIDYPVASLSRAERSGKRF